MVINVFVIWILTVKSFFCSMKHMDGLLETALLLGLLSRVISACLNIYIKRKKINKELKWMTVLKVSFFNILSFFYMVASLASPGDSVEIKILQAIVVVYLYMEARRIYKLVGFITLTTFFENKYKILDLMINLIITAHIFVILLLTQSLALIATTWGNNPKSWIISIGVNN